MIQNWYIPLVQRAYMRQWLSNFDFDFDREDCTKLQIEGKFFNIFVAKKLKLSNTILGKSKLEGPAPTDTRKTIPCLWQLHCQ